MVLSLGEVILRLNTVSSQKLEQASVFEAHWGGSEANVLINLSLLGIPGRFLTKLPLSPLGTAAIRKLQSFGVDCSSISRGGDRIGLYFLEQGTSLRPGKIIYDRKDASVNTLASADISWDSLFRDITWVHWSGITPALSENAAEVCSALISEASRRGLPVSCDLHSRTSLWNYGKSPQQVLRPLLDKTHYLVGDPNAITSVTGEKGNSDDQLNDEELFESFSHAMKIFPSLRMVAMLSRKVINASENILHGILFNGEGYASPDYHIQPVTDRIGSGDAFTAGIIHGIATGMKERELVEWATSLAAYKHTVHGDQLDGSPEDFRSFASGESGKIKR